jgi:hypothetical protein
MHFIVPKYTNIHLLKTPKIYSKLIIVMDEKPFIPFSFTNLKFSEDIFNHVTTLYTKGDIIKNLRYKNLYFDIEIVGVCGKYDDTVYKFKVHSKTPNNIMAILIPLTNRKISKLIQNS